MKKRILIIASIALWSTSFLVACGAPKAEPRQHDGTSGATELAPAGTVETEPSPGAEPASPVSHVCEKPVGAPEEVWPRIEAIRALPDEERALKCGLGTVVLLREWRSVPVDLLAPIVERVAADSAALDAWIADAAKSAPQAAAEVVAMDVVGRFAVGGDPAVVEARRARWSGDPAASTAEIAAVIEEAKLLPKLLAEVNAVHELRCVLEVNALGFAVKCQPIHPATTPITLNWSTTVRDGVLEKVEITECAGKSCPKLRKTAEKLMKRYRALGDEVQKLKSSVFRERIFALMELAPFKGRSGLAVE